MDILIAILVLGGIGLVLGALIGLAAKFLTVEEDSRIEDVTNMLPGANCGGCGHAGCASFANAIVLENADPSGCKPCKPDQVQAIRDYLKKYNEEHKTEE